MLPCSVIRAMNPFATPISTSPWCPSSCHVALDAFWIRGVPIWCIFILPPWVRGHGPPPADSACPPLRRCIIALQGSNGGCGKSSVGHWVRTQGLLVFRIIFARNCCNMNDSSTPNGYGLFPTALTWPRSEEHTSELQSRGHLVCRLLLEKKK